MKSRRRIAFTVVPPLLLAIALGLGGFHLLSTRGHGQRDVVRVVATIHPIAEIVRSVGGDAVQVETLLGAGASPHSFEPRAGQVRSLADADLVVAVGAGLDDWILQLTGAAGRALVVMQVADGVKESDLALSYDGDDGHAGIDPHLWLDPIIVRDVIAVDVSEAIKAIAPELSETIDRRLADFQDELTALDAEVRTALERGDGPKRFISYHSAWRYFARRYGLEEAAAVAEFPGQEPSAQWLASIVRLARQHGVNVIFAEPQLSPKAAQVIAQEINGDVLTLDPIGGPGLDGRSTYADLIRFNAKQLGAKGL